MIRVFIQTEKFKGGPAVFRSRLIFALNKIKDIGVVTNIKNKFDIELAFIRKIYKHSKPYVLRVDGCYYQKHKKSGNKSLKKAILDSSYLIFQSEFSFKLCKHILDIDSKVNDKSNYSIIYNGVDLNYIKKISAHKKIKEGSFVAGARWRDNKRTFSMIKGFLKAKTGRHLYIIGDIGIGESRSYASKMLKYKSKYIHIIGKKSEEETISIMKKCDYLIHLCHIDSCPNIVIEALVCGLNVLCTNLGGTPELVRNDGRILNVDKFWDGKYLSSSVKLDSLNSKIVAKGIQKILKKKTEPDIYRFDINKVAEKYADIIRKNI